MVKVYLRVTAIPCDDRAAKDRVPDGSVRGSQALSAVHGHTASSASGNLYAPILRMAGRTSCVSHRRTPHGMLSKFQSSAGVASFSSSHALISPYVRLMLRGYQAVAWPLRTRQSRMASCCSILKSSTDLM